MGPVENVTPGDALTVHQVIGRNLRAARIRKNVDQAEFGDAFRWNQDVVSKAENGKRPFRVDELLRLALHFEETVEWFLRPPIGMAIDLGEQALAFPELWGLVTGRQSGRVEVSVELLRGAVREILEETKGDD